VSAKPPQYVQGIAAIGEHRVRQRQSRRVDAGSNTSDAEQIETVFHRHHAVGHRGGTGSLVQIRCRAGRHFIEPQVDVEFLTQPQHRRIAVLDVRRDGFGHAGRGVVITTEVERGAGTR
jgi:hypothetical protein